MQSISFIGQRPADRRCRVGDPRQQRSFGEHPAPAAAANVSLAKTKWIEINGLLSQRAAIFQSYENGLAANIATVSILNMTAPVTEPWQQNEAKVNSLELKKRSKIEFSSADWADLYNVSAQCPIAGGDAVFRARVLLSEKRSIRFDNLDLNHLIDGIYQLVLVYPNGFKTTRSVAVAR